LGWTKPGSRLLHINLPAELAAGVVFWQAEDADTAFEAASIQCRIFHADITSADLQGAVIGRDLDHAVWVFVQPNIEPAKVARGHGVKRDCVRAGNFEAALQVPGVDFGHALNGRPAKARPAPPFRLSPPATVFCTTPDHSEARTKVRLIEATKRVDDIHAVPHFNPLNRRLGDGLNRYCRGIAADLRDITHHDAICRGGLRVIPGVRVFIEQRGVAIEPRPHIQVHARAGGAVMMAFAQAIEQAVTVELISYEAGQPAIGTECCCTRIAGARASLMAITVANQPRTVAQRKTIRQQPFKRAPG